MGLRDTLTNLRKWSKQKPDQQNQDPNATQPTQPATTPTGSMPAASPTPVVPSQNNKSLVSGVPTYKPPDSVQNAQQNVTLVELALANLQEREREQLQQQQNMQARLAAERAQREAELQAQPADESYKGAANGEIINGLYRIEKIIASGGMGQVYLATHLGRDNMPVVLKLLLKKPDKNSTEYNRFIQEMLISGRMKHPNLVKVYDYGILLDGLKPYLVMEYVDGEPLRTVLRMYGQLPVGDACKIIIQACDALHEVHAKGVVHRDLKPENLMIKGDVNAIDNVKILDFGIAHVRSNAAIFQPDEEGLAVGSVGYMSPEQICAQPVDHRTDIYSLGLILYETITGHPPFVGGTRRETMAMHVQAKHMPPSAMASIPVGGAELDRIIDIALAKHPDGRYHDVKQLQNDLQALVDRLPPQG
jgi:eukaryotic-like serine/threonine-protein kinase